MEINIKGSGWAYPQQGHPAEAVLSAWCGNWEETGKINVHLGNREQLVSVSCYDEIKPAMLRAWDEWLATTAET